VYEFFRSGTWHKCVCVREREREREGKRERESVCLAGKYQIFRSGAINRDRFRSSHGLTCFHDPRVMK